MSTSFEQFKKQLDDTLTFIKQAQPAGEGNEAFPVSVDALVDTTSLLARCENVCNKYQEQKPAIRVVHHLPCSGGAELSEYLRAIPNAYLLNDIHPFLVIDSERPSLNLADAVSSSQVPNARKLKETLFLENFKRVYEHVSQIGGQLIIKDNAYFDYLSDEMVFHKSIAKLLEPEFRLIPIVLYRDPIDAYASLKSQNLYGKYQLTFEEFCERNKQFISDYGDAKIIRFEDFHGSKELTIKRILEGLELAICNSYGLVKIETSSPQFDSWRPDENDCYKTKLKTAPDFKEIGESKSYFELQKQTKPKDIKLVLIASMPRSGSTWLFNCVREIYKSQNIDFYSCWVDDYDPGNSCPVHVVKIHDPDYRLASQADVIISLRRDIRDIAGSLTRMGWANQGDDFFKQLDWIVNHVHPFWALRCNLELEYTTIINSPTGVIKKVGDSISVDLSRGSIEEINESLLNLKAPRHYDKKTQLHPNHRSKDALKARELLPCDLSEKISKYFKDWLNNYKYLD